MPRRALPKGVYRDGDRLRAIVNTAAGRREKRFELGTPIADITTWRKDTSVALYSKARRVQRTTASRDTLRADVDRYLQLLTIASTASRRSDLLAWVERYGDVPRSSLTQEHAAKAVRAWQASDARTVKGKPRAYAPWTIRHRLEALRQLYKTLDGADVATPVDRVTVAKPAAGRPVFVQPGMIEGVAAKLAEYPDTRARLFVLAVTGARTVEVTRAQPADVDLETGLWTIRTAKGGIARAIRLNTPEMIAAWRAFIAANAWGPYDTTLHARRLRRAGWPDGVRPYALRGSFAMELSRRGVDLADIQQLLGHSDLSTTRLYYVPPEDSRLAAATKLLAGRITVAVANTLPTSGTETAQKVAETGRKRTVPKEDRSTDVGTTKRRKLLTHKRTRP